MNMDFTQYACIPLFDTYWNRPIKTLKLVDG